jgi:putative transposase
VDTLRRGTSGTYDSLKPDEAGICSARIILSFRRPHLGEVFRRLAEQKESRVLEGHLMPDHAHMLVSIPPKYAVSEVVGFIKGKSAIHLARAYGERKQNFTGQHL